MSDTVGAAIAQFTATLTQAATEEVRVNWNTADGTAVAGRDYKQASGVLVFAAGETSKTIDVLVYGRDVGTESRVFYLNLEPPTNAILADNVGACVISVDAGSTPVLSVTIPKGEKGDTGDSAYQTWLDLGNEGTEADFIQSLRPDAAEIAQEVEPLINAGNLQLTAAGTESLPQPDETTLKELAGRVAYMRQTKIAAAPALTAGVNVVPLSAFEGDAVDPAFYSGFNVTAMRGGELVDLDWQYLPDSDEIRIENGQAGDMPVAVQQDNGTGEISKAPVTVGSEKDQLRGWISGLLEFNSNLSNTSDPALGAAIVGYDGGTVADKLGEIVSGAVTEPIVDAKVLAHNHDPAAHPELRSSIISDVSANVAAEAVRAETARDAAFVNADVYPDVASGRAAVADGEQFQVVEGNEIARYRRDSASAQTEVARYPSAKVVRGVNFSRYFNELPLTNQYITVTGGAINTSAWRATDFLPIAPNTSYMVNTQTFEDNYHAWYDASKNFISSFKPSSTALTRAIFTSPAEAAFVRLSTLPSSVGQAYIQATNGHYDADKLNALLSKHANGIPATGVSYQADSVGAALDAILSSQEAILNGQREIYGILDLQSDPDAPWFVNAWEATIGVGGGSMTVHSIASRDSDYQMTLTSIPADSGQAIVVLDDNTGKHIPMSVTSESNGVLTVNKMLPANISQMMRMHDANEGQHLTPFGYRALAEYTVDQIQRYAYKKPENIIFSFHPPVCSTTGFSNSNIWDYSLSEIIIPVTRLPGTLVGGTLSNGVTRSCQTVASDVNITDDAKSQYLSRHYLMRQEVGGAGIEIEFSAQGLDGFVEIPVSARLLTSAVSVGSGLLEVLADGVTILSDTIECGTGVKFRYVDFEKASKITVRYSLVESVPMELRLHGIYAYRKSPLGSRGGLFTDGDVIALLGDSWTEFHGYALENRLQTYLGDQGITVSTANFGKGGQTSAWGLYWVDRVINASPRPTHCLVLFGINDYNSRSAFTNNTPSVYDFDPDNPEVNLPFDLGGIKGSTDTALWWRNLQEICRRLVSAGIRPVVMMPGHTSSSAQSQGIRNLQLNKIAAGFSDVNAPRE